MGGDPGEQRPCPSSRGGLCPWMENASLRHLVHRRTSQSITQAVSVLVSSAALTVCVQVSVRRSFPPGLSFPLPHSKSPSLLPQPAEYRPPWLQNGGISRKQSRTFCPHGSVGKKQRWMSSDAQRLTIPPRRNLKLALETPDDGQSFIQPTGLPHSSE
jgi:hypothetical protein